MFSFIWDSLHLPQSRLYCWTSVVSTRSFSLIEWLFPKHLFPWPSHLYNLLSSSHKPIFYHHPLNLTSQRIISPIASAVMWFTFMFEIRQYILRIYITFVCNNERELYFGCSRMLYWPNSDNCTTPVLSISHSFKKRNQGS